MSFVNPDPIGHVISGFEVGDVEVNNELRWKGAEMTLMVEKIGRFSLYVVTKDHFVEEKLRKTFDDIERPEMVFRGLTYEEEKPPFVLNDEEISDDVLHRKFDKRIVEKDLARSLYYLGPVQQV